MKSRLSQVLAALLCAMLCLTSVPAFAQNTSFYMDALQERGSEDTVHVFSSTAIGDTLYMLGENSLEMWTVGMDEPKRLAAEVTNANTLDIDAALAKSSEGAVGYSLLLEDGEKLYGLDRFTGQLWQLLDDSGAYAPTLKATLEWSDMVTNAEDYYELVHIQDALILEDTFYALTIVYDETGETAHLRRWSMTDGKQAEPLKDIIARSMDVYRDGLLICLLRDDYEKLWDEKSQSYRAPDLATFNPQTNEFQTLCSATAVSDVAVRYNPANDTLYYVSGASVYSITDPGTPAKISAYLPTEVWDSSGIGLLDGGMIYSASYEGVMIRELDSPLIGEGALTVMGGYSSMGHMAFVAEHPEIPITLSSDYFYTLEALSTAMVSGNKSMDIMMLDSTSTPLDRLIQKGYAMDMNASAKLMDVMSQMNPVLAESCMKDGKLYAFPVGMHGEALSYSTKVWEDLGLSESDLPSTLMELMDFVDNWTYDYADDYPNYKLFQNSGVKYYLFNSILRGYLGYVTQNQMSLDFDTELFQKLLTRFDSIDFSEIDRSDSMENESQEFWQMEPVFQEYQSVGYVYGFESESAFLPLPLDEGMEPVIPVQLQVMMINPRTTRPEQALLYIESMSDHLEKEGPAIVMFPGNNEPVVNPYYEENIKWYEERISDLEESLKTADETQQASLNEELAALKEGLPREKERRYSVTAESIAAYREKLEPYLCVVGQTPLDTYTDGKNELQSLIEQYLQGSMKADQFIKEMNKRVRLMVLEDQ